MQNVLSLLVQAPHYIFGRFQLVRSAYGLARGIEQRVTPPPSTIRVGEKFGEPLHEITPAKSPFVQNVLPNQAHVNNLHDYAFSPGLRLIPHAVDHLRKWAQTSPLMHSEKPLPPIDELQADEALLKKFAIAEIRNCSEDAIIQSIAGDRDILDVISRYLGYVPSQAGAWLFWSLRTNLTIAEREAAQQTVRFHYDVHGYNFIYVNFYLQDTDERTGAHVLIESSHRDKKPRHLLGSARLDDDQAYRDYSVDRFRVLRGPAGTGFFEDTTCYHKALAPIDRPRLMLQFRYQ